MARTNSRPSLQLSMAGHEKPSDGGHQPRLSTNTCATRKLTTLRRPVETAGLWLRFSDGSEGEYDMAPIRDAGGPMVEPLRDAAMFARVFVETGAPTWPCGYDLDPINLHMQLSAAGGLKMPSAA